MTTLRKRRPSGRRVLAFLAAVGVWVACGSGGDERVGLEADPARDLARAASATATATGFRVTIADGRTSAPTVVDYEAPDRMRSKASTSETVIVGTSVYISAIEAPGFFYEADQASVGDPTLGVLSILGELERAVGVEAVGHQYAFSIPDDGNAAYRGTATIDDGRLVELAVDLDGDQVRFSFSHFGMKWGIEPPPPTQVLTDEPGSPGLPPCDPDGSPPTGSIVCGETGF